MANPEVETVSTGADKAKLAVAGVLVIGAVAAFYALGKQDLWLRVVALLVRRGIPFSERTATTEVSVRSGDTVIVSPTSSIRRRSSRRRPVLTTR